MHFQVELVELVDPSHKSVEAFGVDIVIPVDYTYATVDPDGMLKVWRHWPIFNGHFWSSSDFPITVAKVVVGDFPYHCVVRDFSL